MCQIYSKGLRMRNNNILIIGDAMIDSHICGTVSRISPEAPVPVLNTIEETYTLGGAANVAAQVAAVAHKTTLMYKNLRNVTGVEDKILGKLLDDHNIKRYRLWMDSDYRPSSIPIKKRVWADNQQICRVDKENIERPSNEETEEWINKIREVIVENEIDKVIFSDYDKGTLTDYMISDIAEFCSARGVLTILDPKRPSFCDIEFLTVVKPNEKELLSTDKGSVESVSLAMDDTFVVATHGDQSTKVAQRGETIGNVSTKKVEVVDVCGAGDVHVAILTLKFNGDNIMYAVTSANAAAAISVQHKGCYTLTAEEVNACLI